METTEEMFNVQIKATTIRPGTTRVKIHKIHHKEILEQL